MRDGLGEEAGELAELYLAWMRLVVAASVERGYAKPHRGATRSAASLTACSTSAESTPDGVEPTIRARSARPSQWRRLIVTERLTPSS
jgi:hypothetical protein